MALAADAVLVLTTGVEQVLGLERLDVELVALANLVGDVNEFEAADARNRAGEVAVDERAAETDGFEDLRAAIALDRRDAHLRADLEQALAERLDVALARLTELEVAKLALGV